MEEQKNLNIDGLANFFGVSVSYIKASETRFFNKKLKYGFLITKEGIGKNALYSVKIIDPEKANDYKIISKKNYYENINNEPETIDGEEWVECYYSNNYLISNLGRAKRKGNKYITKGSKINERNSYLRFDFGKDGRYSAHRVVYKSFNPEQDIENLTIDHINGNESDNRLDNLRLCTQEDNTRFKTENRKDINKNLNEVIKQIGYEETNKLLEAFLAEINAD